MLKKKIFNENEKDTHSKSFNFNLSESKIAHPLRWVPSLGTCVIVAWVMFSVIQERAQIVVHEEVNVCLGNTSVQQRHQKSGIVLREEKILGKYFSIEYWKSFFLWRITFKSKRNLLQWDCQKVYCNLKKHIVKIKVQVKTWSKTKEFGEQRIKVNPKSYLNTNTNSKLFK